MTNRPARRAVSRPVGGGASGVAGPGVELTIGARTAGGGGASGAPAGSVVSGRRASSAARIAAMCSGVVPQQPPMIAAPASTNRGAMSAR